MIYLFSKHIYTYDTYEMEKGKEKKGKESWHTIIESEIIIQKIFEEVKI